MSVSMSEFLTSNEVVFIGLSSNPKSFSRKVYQDFVNAGYKVYPVNPRNFTEPNLKTYRTISEIPQVPECAYILLSKENTREAVKQLKGTAIKKVIIQAAGKDVLAECQAMGIEAIVACPKMFLSGGLIHRFHGLVAGIRK